MKMFDVRHRTISGLAVCFTIGVGVMAMAQRSGTQMRGVSNAKAKRELNFRPRPLEWVAEAAPAHA